ncbi:forkhead box protein D3 [Exaiptasia diaphana]|uniref:Fork-head domain-containing protein n=1 Tax=Exaiptasia diaphana TaxID=2652724 RepID=A0A913YCU8_EXADI|nr:forkhead box protein D3 [Exaiptasia diaphana]
MSELEETTIHAVNENDEQDKLLQKEAATTHDSADKSAVGPLESFSVKKEDKCDDDSDVKPSHSYIALIAMAILSCSNKKMILGDIYQYISDNYPYYRNKDKSWRNSIRHNLSLNECFIKAGRSENGKGNYWAIHPANLEDFSNGDFRRRRARRRVRKSNALKFAGGMSTGMPYLRSYMPFHGYSSLMSAYKGEDYSRSIGTYSTGSLMSPVSYKQYSPYNQMYTLHNAAGSTLSPLVSTPKPFTAGPYSSSLSALASLSYGQRENDSWQETLCKLQEKLQKHSES